MVKKLLELWTKVATNVRMRDRSVKIIQYGCQMLIGYYGCKLSEDIMCGLNRTRSTASTARKAFWLLKSINHLNDIFSLLEAKALSPDRPLAVKLDLLEQVFLVFYYLTENLIFLARCRLFGFDEDKLDAWCNIAWFGGDLSFFFSTILRLQDQTRICTLATDNVKRLHSISAECADDNNSNSTWCSQSRVTEVLNAEKDLRSANQKFRELQLSLVIVSYLFRFVLNSIAVNRMCYDVFSASFRLSGIVIV
jgi:hypothetical protein